VGKFILTFNVSMNLCFSAEIKVIRKISWVISLNITSSSNTTVKIYIVSHNHTFCRAGSYKYRIALTFVKPTCRGEEGQNGWLKCPLGFLVFNYIHKEFLYFQPYPIRIPPFFHLTPVEFLCSSTGDGDGVYIWCNSPIFASWLI